MTISCPNCDTDNKVAGLIRSGAVEREKDQKGAHWPKVECWKCETVFRVQPYEVKDGQEVIPQRSKGLV